MKKEVATCTWPLVALRIIFSRVLARTQIWPENGHCYTCQGVSTPLT